MNYSKHQMTQLHYKDFIKGIEEQYPGVKWDTVQQKINKMFREAFESASIADPPNGFAKTHQARAMYGVDLMIDEDFDPQLLGIHNERNYIGDSIAPL
jgi:hypothetical protein